MPSGKREGQMAYPTYKQIEEALEDELRRRGKPTRPQDLYDDLADAFGLSQEERTRPRMDGQSGRVWSNLVQWARRKLVERGVMADRPYKPWALTEWDKNA